MDFSWMEQHSDLKIEVFCIKNTKECHAELWEALDNHALPYRTVARWVAAFQCGREASANMPHTRH